MPISLLFEPLNSYILILIIGIYYPSGEPISLQLLRCSPFKVDDHVFMGHCLAVAANSTRE